MLTHRFFRRAVLASAATLFLMVGWARAADLSEPKAAALTFVKALADHDLATVRNASVGNDEDRGRVEAMSDLIAAQKKFSDAVNAKFPDKAPPAQQRRNVAADFEEKLKTAELKIEGDIASLRDPKDPNSPPLQLKKVGGDWKVDLSSMQMRGAAVAPEQMKKLADATTTTADEVTSGKYATPIEAQKALTQRMMSLFGGAGAGGGASTRPSTEPSK